MRAVTPGGIGCILAGLQFFFALAWTIYVIYLPGLARQAGIDPFWVPWILVLDQAIFALCDWALGVRADRIARSIGRIGGFVASLTAVSATAFLLLPFVAPAGTPWPLLVLILIWAATSSALRAPPLVLVGRYVPAPRQPWVAGLMLFGTGAAAAASPYLGVALRDGDPRLPFAIAAVAVVLVTFALSHAERRMSGDPAVPASPCSARRANVADLRWFVLAVALLGAGFQLHYFVNAGPSFLRLADPSALEWLLPVFWAGFSMLILPASLVTRRYGGLAAMALGGLLGAAAAWAVMWGSTLATVVTAQFIAGGAWGCALMSATAAALAIGHRGKEGSAAGAMFAVLAVAALARIALTATPFAKDPAIAASMPSLPVFIWLAAGLLLLALARRRAHKI